MLAVATKRSLLLYRYDDARGDFASAAVRELAVPERVRCVAWCGDALCLGFRREYVMLNIATGAMSEVFPTGRAEAPSALPLLLSVSPASCMYFLTRFSDTWPLSSFNVVY